MVGKAGESDFPCFSSNGNLIFTSQQSPSGGSITAIKNTVEIITNILFYVNEPGARIINICKTDIRVALSRLTNVNRISFNVSATIDDACYFIYAYVVECVISFTYNQYMVYTSSDHTVGLTWIYHYNIIITTLTLQ